MPDHVLLKEQLFRRRPALREREIEDQFRFNALLDELLHIAPSLANYPYVLVSELERHCAMGMLDIVTATTLIEFEIKGRQRDRNLAIATACKGLGNRIEFNLAAGTLESSVSKFHDLRKEHFPDGLGDEESDDAWTTFRVRLFEAWRILARAHIDNTTSNWISDPRNLW